MRPLKIALGDLKHKTAGKHTFLMPAAISYIASYLLARVEPGSVEVRLYDDPDIILKDIAEWNPDVVGLSDYCWNSRLSGIVFRYARSRNANVVCVNGGPNFPVEYGECREYLSKRPEVDFYVYFEGEVSFSRLIKKIREGAEIRCLKSKPQEGIMSLHPETGDLVFGNPLPRMTNLDEIPSPYQNGLLDKWFNGYYAPLVETTRGCPFSCGFCYAGQPYFTRIAAFSVQRVKDDLTYIARKMNSHPDILLSISDSNFGMYERDEEIAVHMGKLQDEFGWPNAFNLTTGKRNYDRILRISGILKNRLPVVCSLQSLNAQTLDVIKRKNLPMEEYRKISEEMKKRGMSSVTELIAPMPEETLDSFFKGLESVVNILKPDRVVPYTTMCLNGTYLASRQCREKYRMQTRFRILPRQFGEYLGEKCFEIEEACIATNTLSLNEYLDMRGFSLISSFFSSELFDVVHRHLKELNVSAYDYFYRLWEQVKSGKGPLSQFYGRYMEEASGELWNSPDEISSYFGKAENYEKLLNGEIGDNLIRKYRTELFLNACIPSIELAYSSLEDIAGDNITGEMRECLFSAKDWMLAIRNISAVFNDKEQVEEMKVLQLPYDVNAWYLQGPQGEPLSAFKRQAQYRIFNDTDKLKMMFNEIKKLYGGNFSFQVGKLLIHWNIKDFCPKCEPVNLS